MARTTPSATLLREQVPALWRAVGAALLLLLLQPLVADGGPRRLPKADRWIEATSPHFVFYSNASERVVRRVATDLEELREVLVRLTDLELQAGLPVLIYVFKSDSSFAEYKPRYNEQPANVGGYFRASPHACYIAIDGSSRGQWQDASSIIYHEYVHNFLATNLPSVPLWFSEGLAELYQSFEVGNGTVRIGIPLTAHIVLLRESSLLPLARLFAVEHDSPEYNEHVAQTKFYAESWALVHYLIVGNRERTDQLAELLALLDEGEPTDAAFQQAFATGYETIEKELRSYLLRSVFQHLEQELTIDLAASIRLRPLARVEVLCRLGDLLDQQEGRQDDAAFHYQEALRLQPGYAPAVAGLGYLDQLAGRWPEALARYSAAVSSMPEHALIQYRYGIAVLQTGNEAAAAVPALRRSTRLDATFEPAWVALSRALVASDDSSPQAIDDVETALTIMPGRKDIAFQLLALYLRAGEREQAWQLIERAISLHPGSVRRARHMVLEAELQRVQSLISASRLDEARQELERLDALLLDGETLAAQRITDLRSEITRIRLVDQYNHASRLADEGHHDEAAGLLEEMLRQAPDAPLAESLRSLLYQVRHHREQPEAVTTPFMAALHRYNELLEQGRNEQALAVLEQLRQTQGSGWLDHKIEETRRVILYNRFITRYNEAVDLYNTGDLARARVILQELQQELPEGPEAEMTQELLGDIRNRLHQQLEQ